MHIRKATDADLPAILELAATKRDEYAGYSPVFWRVANDAIEKQRSFFINQRMYNDEIITLVAERDGSIDGFIMAMIHTAPPVYDPGGPVCSIDDFTVAAPDLWPTTGKMLLDAVTSQAQARGAVLVIIVCGHLDASKRAMLQGHGATIASEWYVKPLGN
jgi:ribosomal protein S18 acetylase RimI-like enzyme